MRAKQMIKERNRKESWSGNRIVCAWERARKSEWVHVCVCVEKREQERESARWGCFSRLTVVNVNGWIPCQICTYVKVVDVLYIIWGARNEWLELGKLWIVDDWWLVLLYSILYCVYVLRLKHGREWKLPSLSPFVECRFMPHFSNVMTESIKVRTQKKKHVLYWEKQLNVCRTDDNYNEKLKKTHAEGT